jgi:cell division protein FtsN
VKRKATAKTAPKKRMGQLVLNQMQVGLALGFVIISLFTAFGIGFMVGMWYQASEQITPYEAELTPATEPRPQDPPMTFYSTLTESQQGVDSPSRRAADTHLQEGSSPGTHYSVQVGSFRAREQAERLHSRLVNKGYAARVQSSNVPGKGVWYRVRVGEFPNRADADRTAQRLVSQEQLSVMITNEAW